MIERSLTPTLVEASAEAPVVAVTGPRQSGRTTLCRACFPDHDYVSLEPLDTREFADDPRGFLRQHSGPAIFDEVQRSPDLLSLRLVAGRTGQELNLSGLGSDVGVSHNTVRAWVSVLEASFVVFKLPAWTKNVRKRVVKAPKLHFVDSGLACHLLGIRTRQKRSGVDVVPWSEIHDVAWS